jgi:hypothetical protein
MALEVKHGYFKTGTGVVGTIIPITGVGFALKALLVMYNGRTEIIDATSMQSHRRGIGFAINTLSDRCVTSQSEQNASPIDSRQDMHETRAIQLLNDSGGEAANLTLDAINADGFDFRVVVTPDLDYTIEYYAFGGSDIEEVAIVSVIEPAVAGVVNVDTIGFSPSVGFCIGNATGAATVGISADSRIQFGMFTTEPSIVNATWGGGSNDNANPSQAISYCRLGECIGVMEQALTSVNTRARVTALRPLGLELTYDEVQGSGNRETFILAIRGGQWKLDSFTTSTDLANKVISGLNFDRIPKGGIILSAGHSASTIDIVDVGDEWILGWFTSTSDRAVMAVEEVDNVVTADVQSAYEKDNVYIGCNAVGGIDARIDIGTIALDSLTFTQSLMDSDGRLVIVLAFADSRKTSHLHSHLKGVHI